MAWFECNTCGGRYQDTSPGGYRYFHSCPPIHNQAFQPNPFLPHYDPDEFIPRPGGRDENLVPGQEADGTRIKSEGRGRTPVLVSQPRRTP